LDLRKDRHAIACEKRSKRGNVKRLGIGQRL
jgi:hypothetical protein